MLVYAFVDEASVDMDKLDYVWRSAARRFRQSCVERLKWAQELRAGIDDRF